MLFAVFFYLRIYTLLFDYLSSLNSKLSLVTILPLSNASYSYCMYMHDTTGSLYRVFYTLIVSFINIDVIYANIVFIFLLIVT